MSDPTLEDLLVLNQEIAAFVQAGIPLELGLKGLSGSVHSRLGALSDRLATRMADGRKLSEALAEEGSAVSPIYIAVVEAGLASGKLPEALQSLTESTQVVQEIRRRVLLALVYPAICLAVAYAMFCVFVSLVAPHLIASVDSYSKSWSIDLLRFLVRNGDYVTTVIPCALISLIVVVFGLRKTVARGFGGRLAFRWVTGRSLDWAQFMEILALQVEHGAALPKAFVLAADSTEDNVLRHEARFVFEKLTLGSSLTDALKSARSLPPLARWMLATGEVQGTLVATLRQLCDIYRRRAFRRAQIVKIWLPVMMTIVFTTLIGFTYGSAFIIPARAFLLELMHE